MGRGSVVAESWGPRRGVEWMAGSVAFDYPVTTVGVARGGGRGHILSFRAPALQVNRLGVLSLSLHMHLSLITITTCS